MGNYQRLLEGFQPEQAIEHEPPSALEVGQASQAAADARTAEALAVYRRELYAEIEEVKADSGEA